MTTLPPRLRFRSRHSRLFLFGCLLTVAPVGQSHDALAQQVTTTICKKTIPSPDPSSTSFNFTGANGWATGPNSFNSLYPNPFQLKDGSPCYTINITAHDKFNKFTEHPIPPGWALTNISCVHQKSVVNIVGANANPGFQFGDDTVTIDQNEPNVTCTFVDKACFAPTDLSLPPCTRPGESVTLNLSTATAGVDQNWTVAPGGPNPTHIAFNPWTALPFNWVHPTAPLPEASNAATYTYTRKFNLPCPPKSYQRLQISGSFAADNNGTVTLNNNVIGQCTGNVCFNTPPVVGTPFGTTNQALFIQGINALTVTVGNQPFSFSGLSVVARISAVCGTGCVLRMRARRQDVPAAAIPHREKAAAEKKAGKGAMSQERSWPQARATPAVFVDAPSPLAGEGAETGTVFAARYWLLNRFCGIFAAEKM
jgi:hypothetical protein